MKIKILTLVLVLLYSIASAGVTSKHKGVIAVKNSSSVCSLTSQVPNNDTNYTEYDTGADIVRSSTAVTWTSLNQNDDSYVVRDNYAASYFGGDFTFIAKVSVSQMTDGGEVYLLTASETSGGVNDAQTNSDDYLTAEFQSPAGVPHFRLWVGGAGGSSLVATTETISKSTDYYLTLTREDGAGANSTGQAKLYIRTTSHTGTLVETLSLDSDAGEQADYQYFFPLATNHDDSSKTATGVISNIEVGTCIE